MKKPSPKDLIKFMKSQAEIGIELMKFVTMNKQDIIEIKKQLQVQQSQLKILAENTGLIDPIQKTITLDQSIFDGYSERFQWAFSDLNGDVFISTAQPTLGVCGQKWSAIGGNCFVGKTNRTGNWFESLIERESKELTGSDLARDYFKRGCCPRICFVGEDNDECLSDLVVAMVIGYTDDTGFETSYNEFFPYAALVNSYGDELTASEVGA
ncbi:hypothetical protein [Psychrobacter sp. 16-MNA-CIBAN-0192]|uniref:hypothetical protein n=1 Tax=Psychrobacter sp. 16-MNA-CIBAN-0192 TaxID=3140448 RepID=UPI003325BC22